MASTQSTRRPSISAVSRRWRRVWLSEPAVWREFELRPVPPPEIARRLFIFEYTGVLPWPALSGEELSDSELGDQPDYEEDAADWWNGATAREVAAGFAARRRELEQTAHLVSHAKLYYAHSSFREQALRRGGWQLAQVLRALPVGLAALELETWMEEEDVGKAEAKALVAATSDALNCFPHLTALQVGARVCLGGREALGWVAVSLL